MKELNPLTDSEVVEFVEEYTKLLNAYPMLREAQTDFDVDSMSKVLAVVAHTSFKLYMQLHK